MRARTCIHVYYVYSRVIGSTLQNLFNQAALTNEYYTEKRMRERERGERERERREERERERERALKQNLPKRTPPKKDTSQKGHLPLRTHLYICKITSYTCTHFTL